MTAPTIADRYTLTGELGRGGMAVMHRGQPARTRRRPQPHPPGSSRVRGAERLLREIETAARVHHLYIAPVFDSGSTEGRLYFVTPLIEGETLEEETASCRNP